MSQVSTVTIQSPYESDQTFALMSRGGDYVWLSGQTAHDETGRIVGAGDVVAQARYIFQKIQNVLTTHTDYGLDSVVRLTTYFVQPLDTALKSQYWSVRREFFGNHPPASTGLQVAGLVTPETLIEIDVVAYAPVRPQTTSKD